MHDLEKFGSASSDSLSLKSKCDFSNIIARSPAMRNVLSLLEKVARVDTPVLITGPSGSGKELVARSIHKNSSRRENPFIAINCAAFQDTLLESELFGYQKGAFTGAVTDKIGLYEAAHNGTLFLDEIGELSFAVQAKLLRLVQEGEFFPIGSVKAKKANVRLLAATNRNLREMIDLGQFRDDLFYRLNVVNIDLPPLHERREDIIPIVENLLEKLAKLRNIKSIPLTKEATEILVEYNWRGNVRELENEIERLLILGQDRENLTKDLLSPHIKQNRNLEDKKVFGLKDAVETLERKMIGDTLGETQGNKSEAARILGISRSNLISKVQQYGI